LTGAQPFLHEHFDQYRHADVHGVDAQGGGEFEYFHDLLDAGAHAQCGGDVLADARDVEVSRRGVHRDVHELLGLVVQVVLLPGNRREVEIGVHELRVEFKDRLPRVTPGTSHGDELVLDRLLFGGEGHGQLLLL